MGNLWLARHTTSTQRYACYEPLGQRNMGEAHLGAADWAPDNWVPCRWGAGHLGAVSSYEEKTMKQAIP